MSTSDQIFILANNDSIRFIVFSKEKVFIFLNKILTSIANETKRSKFVRLIKDEHLCFSKRKTMRKRENRRLFCFCFFLLIDVRNLFYRKTSLLLFSGKRFNKNLFHQYESRKSNAYRWSQLWEIFVNEFTEKSLYWRHFRYCFAIFFVL